jgi:tetratricopeptide (TPR) repeat protein
MPGFDLEALKRLPRRPKEIWQGGLVRLPTWVQKENERPFMPWSGAWVSVGTRLVHVGDTVPPSERRSGQALEAFAEFALDPMTGGYLPGQVEVAGPGVAEAMKAALGPLDIAVIERERLTVLEGLLRGLGERLNEGKEIPGALSPEGATLARLASFAEAARLFHEVAPWRHLTSDDLIRIEAPRGPKEHAYALILGARGGEKGLLLFESAGFHERLLDPGTDPELLEQETHDAVVYGEITEMPLEDAAMFEDHGLPVAGPGAYPWAIRFRPKGRIERLSPRALAHAEAVLRALAATTEEEIDAGRWTRVIPAAGGQVTVRLALPGVLDEPADRARLASRPVGDRRSMERSLAEIRRLLEREKGASIEKMQAMIDERFMGRTLDDIPSSASTPHERAQDLCYKAFESRGRRRIILARQALAVSPDCADAWSILAEQSGDGDEVLRCYREAVAAGERALGPGRLTSDEPFWADVLTRPFMRALEGLADACADRGLIAEAIGHYQRLLRLNPNDNQGVRDPLAGLLLSNGDHRALERLVAAYDSDLEVTLLYARALLLMREKGDVDESGKALRRAHRGNRHVAEILLGRVPATPLPAYYAPGSVEEARHVVSWIGEPWHKTAGALEWLGRRLGLD